MKLYYSGYTSNDGFESVKKDVEYILEKQGLPTIEEIVDEGKLVIAFEGGKALIMEGSRIVLGDEIKINPMDYYPEGWEKGDPIPSDTVHKIIAAKLGINQKFLDEALDNDGGFYFETLDKEAEGGELDVQDEYLQNLIETLEHGELLIITRTDDKWIFKGKGTRGIPNGIGKWVNYNGDVFGGEFIDGVANGEGYVKFVDGVEFKGVWENGVMKSISEGEEGSVTFHIEDLNFDNIAEKLVYQKDENGEIRVFQYK